MCFSTSPLVHLVSRILFIVQSVTHYHQQIQYDVPNETALVHFWEYRMQMSFSIIMTLYEKIFYLIAQQK